jgi:hypothetical protein
VDFAEATQDVLVGPPATESRQVPGAESPAAKVARENRENREHREESHRQYERAIYVSRLGNEVAVNLDARTRKCAPVSTLC